MSGANCCHGHDCARYYGEPRRTSRDGQQGWQFGKWFFRDDQLIAADSLAPEERGFHHVCIGVGYALLPARWKSRGARISHSDLRARFENRLDGDSICGWV